jgi:hypothetical protein
VKGEAKDAAGNTGTDSVTIKLDKTAPSISGAVVSGTMGNNGWYVSEVGVPFTCSDSLSGLTACADDVTLTGNSANQSVTRTATDNAGNIGSATVSGISIDNENPTITDVNAGFYKLGTAPAPTCTATDSFSGLLSCKVVVSGGTNPEWGRSTGRPPPPTRPATPARSTALTMCSTASTGYCS